MPAARLRLSASQILTSVLTRSSGPLSGRTELAAVALATDRLVYRPGEQGTVTVRNESSRMLLVNLCGRQLEQQLGDAWFVRERSPGPGEVCRTEPRVVDPGGTARTTFRLPRALPEGVYRWRFFGVGDLSGVPRGSSERLTNSFGVEP
jgi:uncharacterized protein YfaS (alpha-2-macroglobulin family)